MANASTNFFYFYRRYKWRAVDFTLLQQSTSELSRGLAEGAFGASVLNGFEVTVDSGLQLNIAAGIADSATGHLLVTDAISQVTLSAPATGSSPVKSIVVVRPLLEDNTTITRPTNPFDPVPLNQYQKAQVVVIAGTPSATPNYPAKLANDVILCGVRLIPGQVALTENDLDFEHREYVGKNSPIQQLSIHPDDRARPYRSSGTTVGIKPSQTTGSKPKLFLDPGKGQPSIWPKTAGGAFNPADTFLNFQTGAITGGDEVTADFTPTVPTSDNAIVATVVLTTSDTLAVTYGTQGTFAQCLAAIQNQTTVGAGSIAAVPGSYKLCYVIVKSVSGSISDVFVVDGRSIGIGASGGSTPTSTEAAIANNQSSAADVTGFTVDSGLYKGFAAEYAISRRHAAIALAEDTAFYGNMGSAFGGEIYVIIPQPDGKVVYAGNFTTWNGATHNRIIRLNADGTEDTSFSTNVGTGFNALTLDGIRQPDGKLLFVGQFVTFNGNTRNRILRLNSDGTEDTAFYTTLTSTGDGTAFSGTTSCVRLQSDGKIVVGGFYAQVNGVVRSGLARLSAAGLDDGVWNGALPAYALANNFTIAVDSQDRIIGGNNTSSKLFRLSREGVDDSSFYNNNGATGFSASFIINMTIVQPDGKIVVVGRFTTHNGVALNGMGRFNEDGTPDTAFNANFATGFNNDVLDMALQPTGKFIVGGQYTSLNGATRNRLVRINSDGTEDTAFYTAFSPGAGTTLVGAVRLGGNKAYIGGTFTSFAGNTRNRAAVIQSDVAAIDLHEQGTLRGVYRNASSSWELCEDDIVGDDSGVRFSITTLGQLRYVSTDLTGSLTESVVRYLIGHKL